MNKALGILIILLGISTLIRSYTSGIDIFMGICGIVAIIVGMIILSGKNKMEAETEQEEKKEESEEEEKDSEEKTEETEETEEKEE